VNDANSLVKQKKTISSQTRSAVINSRKICMVACSSNCIQVQLYQKLSKCITKCVQSEWFGLAVGLTAFRISTKLFGTALYSIDSLRRTFRPTLPGHPSAVGVMNEASASWGKNVWARKCNLS